MAKSPCVCCGRRTSTDRNWANWKPVADARGWRTMPVDTDEQWRELKAGRVALEMRLDEVLCEPCFNVSAILVSTLGKPVVLYGKRDEGWDVLVKERRNYVRHILDHQDYWDLVHAVKKGDAKLGRDLILRAPKEG